MTACGFCKEGVLTARVRGTIKKVQCPYCHGTGRMVEGDAADEQGPHA